MTVPCATCSVLVCTIAPPVTSIADYAAMERTHYTLSRGVAVRILGKSEHAERAARQVHVQAVYATHSLVRQAALRTWTTWIIREEGLTRCRRVPSLDLGNAALPPAGDPQNISVHGHFPEMILRRVQSQPEPYRPACSGRGVAEESPSARCIGQRSFSKGDSASNADGRSQASRV